MRFKAKFTRKATQLPLYHGSRKEFPVGFTLLPQSDGYASSSDESIANTERILESHRPAQCLPRAKSVFMVTDPEEIDFAGGYTDFVYQVEPVGKVEKNDMAWYSSLATVIWDDVNDPEAIRLAEGYWSGQPEKPLRSFEYRALLESHTLFEYRAPSAKIIRVIECSIRPIQSRKRR